MTNFERWQLYTKNFPSPQSYIDFGFYWLISTCLQRRVWYYDGDNPLFPNMYVVFVGPPSVGKGLVIGAVNRLIKHHKYEKGALIKTNIGTEFPPLFPVGADTTTFEDLMQDVAGAIRRIPTLGRKTAICSKDVYVHTSYAFCLEELSSLFKKHKEDVVKFLINAYDCKEYEYKTKHQGKDLLRVLCMSFLAGTQLDFLKDAQKAGVFGQGFSSRTVFVFETSTRFDAFHISTFDAAQEAARDELLNWLKKLATLYGPITYDANTEAWLEDWYMKKLVPKRDKSNARMQEYLGRKKVALLKLAAGVHFSESLDMIIPLSAFEKALALLDGIEDNIEAGLAISGRNELYAFTRKMLALIRNRGEVTKEDLILEFAADMNLDEIERCIKELMLGFGVKERLKSGDKMVYTT